MKNILFQVFNKKILEYSRSSFRTGFYIPELKIMLDVGPQNFNKPYHIFITHTHIDHTAGLPLTLIGDEKGDHVFNVHIHGDATTYVKNYIDSMFSCNAMTKIDTSQWYKMHTRYPGDVFKAVFNKQKYEIEVFECDHSIPTVGYGFPEIKTKLKKEYLGCKGQDIKKLKDSGIDITDDILLRRFTFVCDTSINVFKMNPNILKYPVIFIECTFIKQDDISHADAKKHIHWEQLKPIVKQNKDKLFVLFHFSLKYKDSEIIEFFSEECKKNEIYNIKP